MFYSPYQISASGFREHAGRRPTAEDIPEDYHVVCEDACTRLFSWTALVIFALGIAIGCGLAWFLKTLI